MEKRLEYNEKDSGLSFILVLFVPLIFSSIIVALIKIIFPTIDLKTYNYLALIVNQIAFFLLFICYNKFFKINGYKASKIKFKLNLLQMLIIIVIGLVALYGLSYLVNYFEYLMSLMGYKFDNFNFLDVSNVGMLLITIFTAALLPSIFEELIFRGIIFNGIKSLGQISQIVISGLMFAIMHQSLQQSIYQLILGMVLASVVLITGTIISSMLLHFFNNFFILFMAFISSGTQSQEAELWMPKNLFEHFMPFILAIVSVLVIYLLLCLLKKCTKDSQCKIFNFKKQSTIENKENINTISESKTKNKDDKETVDKENADLSLTENKVKENKLYLYASLAMGVVIYIAVIIIDLVTNIK